MSDLPERLRVLTDSLEGDDWDHPLLSREACRDAAAEIESLRADRNRRAEQNGELLAEIERLRAEIDRMRPELIRLLLSAQRRDCERSDCRPDERDMI